MKSLAAITLFVFVMLLFSCENNPAASSNDNAELAKKAFFEQVYNPNNIRTQAFKIYGNRDTSIVAKYGTIFRFYANTFEQNGAAISGAINVQIKEVFKKSDFVLGNLTTTSNGKLLESDGMIYVNARANGKRVKISKGKEIGVMVPDKRMDKRMKIFEGKKEGDFVNWVKPEKTLNNEIKELERTFRSASFRYNASDADKVERENEKIEAWLWKSNRKVGDTLHFKDFYVFVSSMNVNTIGLKESANGVFVQDVVTQKGTNGFVEDYNTNYIFKMKKLGWANIDKLYKDPKSEEVTLLVNVENESEFDYIFTSMIFSKNKIYLSGYQKEDNSFGFSHGDTEKSVFPIGAEVTILATAYKNDQPFFNMKKFKLKKEQDISFALNEISIDDLKASLEENL